MECLSKLIQRLNELVHMLSCVCRGHLDSESCFAFGDDGVAEADDEDAVFEELFGHRDGSFGWADDDGADGGGGFEDIKIRVDLDLLAAIFRDVAELLHALGFVHQRADRGVCTRGDGDRQGVAEQRWAPSLDDEIDELLGTSNESPGSASESFTQGACEDIDLSDHVVVFVGAASGLAEHAVGVGVVDAEEGVVLIAELSQLRKIGDVAFHGEDAVGDEPDLAGDFGVVLCFFEDLAYRVHIGVLVDALLDALLDDRGQTHRVDDAGVIEFIGDDDVPGFARGGEESLGGVPAGDECVGGFGSHVLGDCFFEGMVGGEGAADEADGRGAGAVGSECFDPGFDDIGMVGESEVVVGAHADALVARTVLVNHGDGRVHGGVEGLEDFHLSRGGEGVEGFFGADGECGGGRCG